MEWYRVALVSYVDGLGLAAEEWAALVALLQGYIDWCALLHLMEDPYKVSPAQRRHVLHYAPE